MLPHPANFAVLIIRKATKLKPDVLTQGARLAGLPARSCYKTNHKSKLGVMAPIHNPSACKAKNEIQACMGYKVRPGLQKPNYLKNEH